MRYLPLLLMLAAAPPSWVERSNENARLMLDVQARFLPESSGVLGIEGLDEAVQSLPPEHAARPPSCSGNPAWPAGRSPSLG